MGARAWIAVVLLAVAAGAFALTRGENDDTPGTSSTPAETRKQAPPKKRKPARGSQPVREGGKGKPDQPAPGTSPLLAIADQKPETFSDPRFRKLGVRRTRLNIPWNAIDAEPARIAAWLNAARQAGLEPLVAFEHARGEPCPADPCTLPPVSAYRAAVAKFRRAYPWVDHIQPWNEANSATQPTGKRPERAAAYYEAVRDMCSPCVIPAADLLDSGNMARWLRRFKRALKGPTPRLWGLHNYSDTNRFRDTGTKRFLSLVPGDVWLTEAGGIVTFVTQDGRPAFPEDAQRAARATRYLLRLGDRFRARIKRIYIYQWRIDFPGNRFDAGLVDWEGRPRPALDAVQARRNLLR